MYNNKPHIPFSITVLFLQIFVLNNITFTSYVVPLLYISIIVIMPLKSTRGILILTAVILGIMMDLSMGTYGLNLASTLPLAYFRQNILFLCNESANSKKDGFPSKRTIGYHNFICYVLLICTLHSLLFFMLEAMTFSNIEYLLTRFILSTIATLFLTFVMLSIFKKRMNGL